MKFISLIIVIISCGVSAAVKSIVTPIILVPGIGGSSIEMKLNKPRTNHPLICERKTKDYVLLWYNFHRISRIPCFVEDMRLHYNAANQTTSNTEGVETRIFSPDAGVSKCFVTVWPQKKCYFGQLVEELVNHGYEEDVSLAAAAYDFRKGPNEQQEYFDNFKKLVVRLYEQNGNKKVTLIVHSMGGPMTLVFLQQQTKEFKDKYIYALISLAGAYGGSFLATSTFVRGLQTIFSVGTDIVEEEYDPFDYQNIVLKPKTKPIRELARSFPTLYYLFPSPLAWNDSHVLIETRKKNYAMGNIDELFHDLNEEEHLEMYKDVLKYQTDFTAPEVEVHCLYGSEVPTLNKLEYNNLLAPFPKGVPHKYFGFGDGTVNSQSLELCRRWKGQQKEAFYEKAYPSVDHMEVIAKQEVIDYILDVVKAK